MKIAILDLSCHVMSSLYRGIKAQSTSNSVQPKKSPSECVKEKPG
jgi:hypothetical protein